MVKNTITETVLSWGRGGTAEAMVQNEQTNYSATEPPINAILHSYYLHTVLSVCY